jgi:hypothetical protein
MAQRRSATTPSARGHPYGYRAAATGSGEAVSPRPVAGVPVSCPRRLCQDSHPSGRRWLRATIGWLPAVARCGAGVAIRVQGSSPRDDHPADPPLGWPARGFTRAPTRWPPGSETSLVPAARELPAVDDHTPRAWTRQWPVGPAVCDAPGTAGRPPPLRPPAQERTRRVTAPYFPRRVGSARICRCPDVPEAPISPT